MEEIFFQNVLKALRHLAGGFTFHIPKRFCTTINGSRSEHRNKKLEITFLPLPQNSKSFTQERIYCFFSTVRQKNWNFQIFRAYPGFKKSHCAKKVANKLLCKSQGESISKFSRRGRVAVIHFLVNLPLWPRGPVAATTKKIP